MDADLLHQALGSATAGIISRICTHPLDTAKARLQSGGKAANTYRGPVDVLRKTIRTEGIRGWYRGFGAILVGGTPGTMVYLCSYEMIKKRLSAISSSSTSTTGAASSNGDNNESFVVHFASGMLAETIACIVYVPVDVIKERLQVQQQQQRGTSAASAYHGSYDAMRKIMKNEGLGGIYKGYGATLLSFGPFSAVYFGLYEFMKKSAREHLVSKHKQSSEGNGEIIKRVQDGVEFDLPFHWVVGCSAGAGAAASWLTSPLDMAKLRLQVQRGNAASGGESGQVMYRGMVDALEFAFRDGGIRGLFKGALARVLHFTPATCITMTAYESCKSFYAKILP